MAPPCAVRCGLYYATPFCRPGAPTPSPPNRYMKQLTALALAILVTLIFLVVGYYGAITLLHLWARYGAIVWLVAALLVAAIVLVVWRIVQRKS